MKMLFFFFAFSLLSLNSHAQYIVGNAGDGVFYKGQVYLRDLFEADLTPQFTNELAPQFSADSAGFREGFPWPRLLLLRKLSELERVRPHLGSFLFEAIRVYEWKMIAGPLALLPGRPSLKIPESQRVQLAVRRKRIIYVDQGRWSLMPEEQRAALILHEVFSALLERDCVDSACETTVQASAKVYALVVAAFSSHEILKNSAALFEILNIPAVAWSEEGDEASFMRIEFFRQTYAHRTELGSLTINPLSGTASARSFVQKACEYYFSIEGTHRYMRVTARRSPFVYQYSAYCAPFGVQYELTLFRRPKILTLPFRFPDPNACLKTLENVLVEDIISGRDDTSVYDVDKSCEAK